MKGRVRHSGASSEGRDLLKRQSVKALEMGI
jgi:hypothetical protein